MLALSLALGLVAVGGHPPAFPYPVEQFVLKNGLQVIVVPRPGTGLLSYYTLVRVGSRNEVEPGRSGYAHFFEHMMFAGTPRWPSHRYEGVIKQYGANNNAYTDDDLTLYTTTGRADGLEQFVEIEADRFQNLSYTEAAFKTEAAAVLGEYNKAKSNPRQKMFEVLLDTAFTRHSYKHTVIGFEADIRAMPAGYQYARGFFKKYYAPDNAVLIIVGDVEVPRVKALVERAYAGWKGKAVVPRTQKEPPQKQERRVVVPWDKPARPRLMMGWHTPASGVETVKEAAVAGLVDDLVFGSTSPLHKDLVLDRQLCDDVGAWWQDHREPGLFFLSATVRDATRMKEVEAAIDAALEDVAKNGIPPERLEAVKSHERYAFLSQLEKDSSIADAVANMVHLTGSLDWMEQLFAAQREVTSEDVRAFVSTWLTRNNRTVVTLQSTVQQEQGSP